jgi:hypothetical protein
MTDNPVQGALSLRNLTLPPPPPAQPVVLPPPPPAPSDNAVRRGFDPSSIRAIAMRRAAERGADSDPLAVGASV